MDAMKVAILNSYFWFHCHMRTISHFQLFPLTDLIYLFNFVTQHPFVNDASMCATGRCLSCIV